MPVQLEIVSKPKNPVEFNQDGIPQLGEVEAQLVRERAFEKMSRQFEQVLDQLPGGGSLLIQDSQERGFGLGLTSVLMNYLPFWGNVSRLYVLRSNSTNPLSYPGGVAEVSSAFDYERAGGQLWMKFADLCEARHHGRNVDWPGSRIVFMVENLDNLRHFGDYDLRLNIDWLLADQTKHGGQTVLEAANALVIAFDGTQQSDNKMTRSLRHYLRGQGKGGRLPTRKQVVIG